MQFRFLSILSVASLIAVSVGSPALADALGPEDPHELVNSIAHSDYHQSGELEDLSDDAAATALQPGHTREATDVLEAARILGGGPCPVLVTLDLGYSNPGGLADTYEWLNAEADPRCGDITELTLTVSISDSGLPAVGDGVATPPRSDGWDPPFDVGRALYADAEQSVPIGSLESRAHGIGSNLLWFVALEGVVRGQDVAVCWGVSARQGVTDITVMKGC